MNEIVRPSDITDYKEPELFINRELSWLDFNYRVLEEAQDPQTPELEKIKFISIFSSNLDEFYMVRVGSLSRAREVDLDEIDPAGLSVQKQLDTIAASNQPKVAEQYTCLRETVLPGLARAGIHFHTIRELPEDELRSLRTFFLDQVFPILTPLAVDAGHPFPYLGNLKENLMVLFAGDQTENHPQAMAFVEIPSIIDRLIPVMESADGYHFIFLEDVIAHNLDIVFSGMIVEQAIPIRVTRNLDYDLHENEVLDLLTSLEAELKDRSNQIAVRLEIKKDTPPDLIRLLCEHLNLDPNHVYEIDGPLNTTCFMKLMNLKVDPAFRDPPFNPRIPQRLDTDADIFKVISDGDILLHHPYDSFAVVVDFINRAAMDPHVLAIKQTLYRTGSNSPIVAALIRAAENGKQVTAILELKARFDEESNIGWSHRMADAGINIVFGFVKWKVHCKATLVVRREKTGLKKYVHLSTGNYNSSTAKLYTDIGLLTADDDFGHDVSSLFNVITGFNSWVGGRTFSQDTVMNMFRKIAISPVNTMDAMISRIKREIEKSTPEQPGLIIAKMNALVEPKMIRWLYKASAAGVRINLIVRGICCLRPGIPGISDTIQVTSILDRFLEHTRIYYFHNGGDPEIFSGSADWMPRNFKRRVEALFPIEDKRLKTRIIDEILMTYLNDNVKARVMQSDGSYRRVERIKGQHKVCSQIKLIAIARKGGVKSPPYEDLVKALGTGPFESRLSEVKLKKSAKKK
ncbi:polyphosphate kinase 1 [bacterium]|nr:polyphosphate kinase 1 [candidate division CSSED10-310 bacterium]